MPIYAFLWPAEGWVKLGWADDVPQRAADSFADNSHPRELCRKLELPHFVPLGLWRGTQAEEIALQEQLNGGVLRRKDCHNEFYPQTEWPKIQRDLDTHFVRLPLSDVLPPASKIKRSRACCRGWAHWCAHCGTTFASNANRKRHLERPPSPCKKIRNL